MDYFKRRGVSTIFLLRRNPLRRLISLLANTYDKDAKLLNGTHKSHVHSAHEVSLQSRYTHFCWFYELSIYYVSHFLLAGSSTSQIQTNCKYVVTHTQFEEHAENFCHCSRLLQEHETHCLLLRRYCQQSHCKPPREHSILALCVLHCNISRLFFSAETYGCSRVSRAANSKPHQPSG